MSNAEPAIGSPLFPILKWRSVLDTPEVIFARVGADQKKCIAEALKQKRHIVAVAGDGINDAPALKSAHIGIAMGIEDTDVAKEAADMVLLDDNFASIVSAIDEGRAVFSNIRGFLTYILAHNVPEVVPHLAFSLFNIPLALTPIQILAIDMGIDSLTALALGVEKPNPQILPQFVNSKSVMACSSAWWWRSRLIRDLAAGSHSFGRSGAVTDSHP